MDKSNILTIIIPVYNRENLVLNALDSIAVQGCDNCIKVIVVDDFSTDFTVRNVKEWGLRNPQIDLGLLTTEIKGVSGARNRGLKEVKTNYVMFFDSDDQMRSGFLNTLIGKLVDSHADLIGWDVNFTGNGKHKHIFKVDNIWRNHLVHGALSTQRYVARTSLLRDAGGWNETLRAWTDFELGVRLLLLTPEIEKLNIDFTQTINVNYTKNSITGSGYFEDPEKWIEALDKIEDLIIENSPDKIGWIQYRRAILAAEFSCANLKDNAAEQLVKSMCHDMLPNYCIKSIFYLHKIFKRGTWILARFFIEKEKIG